MVYFSLKNKRFLEGFPRLSARNGQDKILTTLVGDVFYGERGNGGIERKHDFFLFQRLDCIGQEFAVHADF